MKTDFRALRPVHDRRGVTLIEMLVACALLVLMMTIIVQVFGAATGAVSTQRVYQELDTNLRQVDAMLRQDLANVTARFTPPLDPKNNYGYFEYIENSFADNQGEDADDCLRFTAKAPEGQVFTGRMYVQPAFALGITKPSLQRTTYLQSQPITITSQYAEIIYFLRNGNLYRRVLLVAPDLQSSIQQVGPGPQPSGFLYNPFNPTAVTGLVVSWQGMNDISAHPSPTLPGISNTNQYTIIILNTLGDLTNRENRAFTPRFVNDFTAVSDTTIPPALSPDGIPDDDNGDSVPDFWPSLYPNAIAAGLLNEPLPAKRTYGSSSNMAFPYIYQYAYSHPDEETLNLGWIHSPNPKLTSSTAGSWLNVLNALNHNPLVAGDSLANPTQVETWWGFPTWRETMHASWTDPYRILSANGQSLGLVPLSAAVLPTDTLNFLPPMTNDYIPGTNTQIRLIPQPNHDVFGSNSSFITLTAPAADALWKQLWEDDLIMTGVRSFDVKAYDPSFGGYVDLGWGDDVRLSAPYVTAATLSTLVPQYLGPIPGANPAHVPTDTGATTGTPSIIWPPKLASDPTAQFWNLYPQTFAHEGRIPPLTWDLKLDAQTGIWPIGENFTTTVRLRRVWDSWSTDYSNAPANGINPLTGQPLGPPFPRLDPATGLPPLNPPYNNAIYPSYPPPYPLPLRGLRIQIRVADPRSEKAKTLTITQDFSDKL